MPGDALLARLVLINKLSVAPLTENDFQGKPDLIFI